jgi:predicted ester cyclase
MPATPSDVLRIWFNRVWNAGDESAIDELYADTAVAHGLPAALTAGPDGFKPLYRSFRTAFPNIQIEVLRAVSEGELGVVHCRVTATHTGELLGTQATNRTVSFDGMVMARVVDGRIQEGWNFFDFPLMYQQLGIAPPQPV